MRAALFTAAMMFALLPALPVEWETETAVDGGSTVSATTAVILPADVDRRRHDKLHRRRGLGRAFADGSHRRRRGSSGVRGLRFVPTR